MKTTRVQGHVIRDVMVWSTRCSEHFFPWRTLAAQPMRESQIAEAGISDIYPGYELGRTQPRFHLLVYTGIGTGCFYTQETTREVRRGLLLIVPAGTPFGYKPDKGRWRFMWFHLPDNERWAKLRGMPAILRPTYLTEVLESATEGYLKESRGRGPTSQRAAMLYAELIGLYISRELGSREEPVSADIKNRLYNLWDTVNDDLKRPWTVEEMADLMAVSPAHLHRITREHANASPMKMVTRLRMERAQELLIIHPYPIRVIADMVGYQNEFAFSVAFKRFSGVTPGQFRERR